MASPTGVARFLWGRLQSRCFGLSVFERRALERRAFVCLRQPSYFLSLAREKVTKERGTPLGACRAPARQVREPGPGFSTAHPCTVEKEPTSCRFPLRGLSSPPHRRTRDPGQSSGPSWPALFRKAETKPEQQPRPVVGQRQRVGVVSSQDQGETPCR